MQETGKLCVDCMKRFSAADQEENMYACNQYCTNPYTMRTSDQVDQCYQCLEDRSVEEDAGASKDVSSCEQCIQAFTGTYPLLSFGVADYDTQKRGACMTCIGEPTTFPDRDWACIKCGQLYNPAVSDACYTCLSESNIDPCRCVDGWESGWLCYEETPTCLTDGAGLIVHMADTSNPSRVNGGSVLLEEPPFVLDACADIAQAEGADLFALLGEQCFFFTSSLEFLNGLVDAGLVSENECEGVGQVHRSTRDLDKCLGVGAAGARACICSEGATCVEDDDLPTCSLSSRLSTAWQRRCECGDDQLYVEGTGCVDETNPPTNEVVVRQFFVPAFQGKNDDGDSIGTPQDVDAFCAISKKLAFCLNDRGTYGTAQRNVAGEPAPWDVLDDAMFYSQGDERRSNTQLNIIFAEAGLGNDPDKTFDYMSPFAIRGGWTMTASDSSGNSIKHRNNRDNGGFINSQGNRAFNDGFPQFCDLADVSNNGCTGVDQMYTMEGVVSGAASGAGSVGDPSTGKLIWSGRDDDNGIELELTIKMTGADAQNLVHTMNITSTGGDLADVQFAWVFDPDSNFYRSGRTIDSVFHIFNDADLSQVAVLDAQGELPALLFTTCDDRARAGTVSQGTDQTVTDVGFADELGDLSNAFPAAASVTGNNGMFLHFNVGELGADEWTTLTWTVGFIGDAVAKSSSAFVLSM
eukprot:222986-Chlamydomonas_euryale.AAC.2